MFKVEPCFPGILGVEPCFPGILGLGTIIRACVLRFIGRVRKIFCFIGRVTPFYWSRRFIGHVRRFIGRVRRFIGRIGVL